MCTRTEIEKFEDGSETLQGHVPKYFYAYYLLECNLETYNCDCC